LEPDPIKTSSATTSSTGREASISCLAADAIERRCRTRERQRDYLACSWSLTTSRAGCLRAIGKHQLSEAEAFELHLQVDATAVAGRFDPLAARRAYCWAGIPVLFDE
jgi:hypothetical protein